MRQEIRFCTSFDGARIAYATTGTGTPLVKAPHWLTHLEHELQSPIFAPWIEALSSRHALLRIDQRGCGLSDSDAAIGFDAWVRDLEAVVDAAGLARFALLGASQGASIAIEYAARHPERVSHLVLLGGYGRGSLRRGLPPERVEELRAQLQLVESGWGRDDPSYRHMFAMQFAPGANLEQIHSLSELQRRSSSPANARRILETFFQIDVTPQARNVRCPTLVAHAQDDRRSPFEEGRLLATLIPNARLLPLETSNHILLAQDPAFGRFIEELYAFVPPAEPDRASFRTLTERERQILHRIAQGLDNAQTAAHLGLSEKTVRNHITRIFDKLSVENRAQAIVMARDAGFGRN